MPIYIVRWNNPDPSVCLVKARSREEALQIMDDIHADPAYCEVREYRGFLVLNLDLKMKWRREDAANSIVPHTVVDDVTQCVDEIPLIVQAEAETKLDVVKVAFPHYDRYLDKWLTESGPLPRKAKIECKKAIQQDFDDMEKKIRAKFEPESQDVLEQADDILREVGN